MEINAERTSKIRAARGGGGPDNDVSEKRGKTGCGKSENGKNAARTSKKTGGAAGEDCTATIENEKRPGAAFQKRGKIEADGEPLKILNEPKTDWAKSFIAGWKI